MPANMSDPHLPRDGLAQYIRPMSCLFRHLVVAPMVRCEVDSRIRGIALYRSDARIGNGWEVQHHYQLK